MEKNILSISKHILRNFFFYVNVISISLSIITNTYVLKMYDIPLTTFNFINNLWLDFIVFSICFNFPFLNYYLHIYQWENEKISWPINPLKVWFDED